MEELEYKLFKIGEVLKKYNSPPIYHSGLFSNLYYQGINEGVQIGKVMAFSEIVGSLTGLNIDQLKEKYEDRKLQDCK